MKVEIRDLNVFNALAPTDLEHYLRGKGWQEIRREDGISAIWEQRTSAGLARVWLPLDGALADYATVMAQLVRTVAEASDLSQLDLLEDVETTGTGDVIRIATWDKLNRHSSSIPFTDGLPLLRQSYRMAQASALATVEKRPVHPARAPGYVVDYLKRLRLGQSERGSYRVKMISPIQERSVSQPALPGIPEQVPFERRVTLMLMNSLEALQRVANDVTERGRFAFEPFQEAVAEGISANLCEAIAPDIEDERADPLPLEVGVSWSYLLPAPAQRNVAPIQFTSKHFTHIAEAARRFRERYPEPIAISGFVNVLSREHGVPQDASGMVHVHTQIGRAVRVVKVELPKRDYQEAIRAHERDLRVSVEGLLIKQGRSYLLQQPERFHIVEEQSSLLDADM